MSYIVRTHQLTKTFQGKDVVAQVDMSIKKGEIYGFLGPNGAGKTTVMRMIAGLFKPTWGEIILFGEKLTNHSYELLKRMGSIIEYPVFYKKLTARENLELHCEYMGFYDKQAIDKSLDLVNLKGVNHKQVGEFSLGMKQRLGIARAIITKPEFLMLDEPINGLDPIGIKEIRSLFKLLCKEYGITLLISSHILGEIEQVADTVGVINQGRLIEEVSMESIRRQSMEYVEVVTNDNRKAALVLADTLKIKNFKVMEENKLRIYDMSVPQSVISNSLFQNAIGVESIIRKNASLEDHFVALMKGGELSA